MKVSRKTNGRGGMVQVRKLMEAEILRFWDRHPELRLFGMVSRPQVGPTYFFEAADRVRLYISIDFGRRKHLSFRKAHPPLFRPEPTSEEEMASYLDFFGEARWFKTPSPPGESIHFCEVGCPRLGQGGLDSQ